MPPKTKPPTTSVLLIDGNDTDRRFFADQLRHRSSDYKILEATDGEAGLTIYRSRRIDCAVVARELPDQSGFKVLNNYSPLPADRMWLSSCSPTAFIEDYVR